MTHGRDIRELVDHFFRHEAGRLVSVLTKIFGIQNLDIAEDVVQDAMLEAISHWQYRGVPDKPVDWFFMVAKNKLLNFLKKEKNHRQYSKEITHLLQSEWTREPALHYLFSEEEIEDDQLRMIFTCCHPAISPDSQIALALKTLCGFSIPEIARAFLTTEDNIQKRLVRARQKIREQEIPFEVPPVQELTTRLNVVLSTIYLLFNEGYSASQGDDIIRFELCEEAIRLTQILVSHKAITQKGNAFALLSLMFLDTSRFKARQDSEGNLFTMEEQDRSLWDSGMKKTGLYYLGRSTEENDLSIYHILATISAHYSIPSDFESTNWENIVNLYDSLVQLDNSPVVLLNRTVALSKVNGPKKALSELQKLKDSPALKSYYLYYATEADLYCKSGLYKNAIASLQKAIELAPLQSQKDAMEKKIRASGDKLS